MGIPKPAAALCSWKRGVLPSELNVLTSGGSIIFATLMNGAEQSRATEESMRALSSNEQERRA